MGIALAKLWSRTNTPAVSVSSHAGQSLWLPKQKIWVWVINTEEMGEHPANKD